MNTTDAVGQLSHSPHPTRTQLVRGILLYIERLLLSNAQATPGTNTQDRLLRLACVFENDSSVLACWGYQDQQTRVSIATCQPEQLAYTAPFTPKQRSSRVNNCASGKKY